MLRRVVDAQRLVHLDVLAGLDTAPAEDALVRIIRVERTRVVLRIGLAPEGIPLNRDLHVREGVVQRAIARVVLSHRAVELVLGEQAIHAFLACARRTGAAARHLEALARAQGAAADELAARFHPADVAGLQRPEGPVITDVRQVDALRGQEVDEGLVRGAGERPAVEAQRALHAERPAILVRDAASHMSLGSNVTEAAMVRRLMTMNAVAPPPAVS